MCTWRILNIFAPFFWECHLRKDWLNRFLLFYPWSTCQQYRYLVILLYDGILSAGQSPHIQCFLTLPYLSWTTTANCDINWVCLGYMNILISSLSDASAWKKLEIKVKWRNDCMSHQFQSAFWSSVALWVWGHDRWQACFVYYKDTWYFEEGEIILSLNKNKIKICLWRLLPL